MVIQKEMDKNLFLKVGMEENHTIVEATNFSISFSWKNTSITITLKNGEDVLKLASAYKNLLRGSNIEYTEEIKELDQIPSVQNLNKGEKW